MNIRIREDEDIARVRAFLAENHTERGARLGELLNPLDYPALIAEESGRLLGVLTYIIRDEECEIFTIHAAQQWRGTGTALISEVERIATEEGCTRVWLITTNDNVDALRFYQRRGFELAALHRGAVDYSRAHLKPEISELGDYDIPLRDEIELEKRLGPAD
jgi:ribosomal protein S18 acetylase RimI-like enzyme